MTTLQTGTKVLIEATVESSKPMYVTVKTKSAEIFRVSPSDLTVCETAEPVPTPSFKAGQEVEGSNQPFNETNRIVITSRGRYVYKDGATHIIFNDTTGNYEGYDHIRPIPTQPTVESELSELFDLLAEGEISFGDLTEQAIKICNRHITEHQKHSGRVEVSVPSDKIPTMEESEREMKRIFGSVSDKFVLDNYYFGWRTFYQWMSGHFMTRKEQQG